MLAYLLLAASVGRNLANHRAGRPTMCGIGRRHIPRAVALLGWAGFNAWFIPHWWRGYPTKETR